MARRIRGSGVLRINGEIRGRKAIFLIEDCQVALNVGIGIRHDDRNRLACAVSGRGERVHDRSVAGLDHFGVSELDITEAVIRSNIVRGECRRQRVAREQLASFEQLNLRGE